VKIKDIKKAEEKEKDTMTTPSIMNIIMNMNMTIVNIINMITNTLNFRWLKSEKSLSEVICWGRQRRRWLLLLLLLRRQRKTTTYLLRYLNLSGVVMLSKVSSP